MVVPPSRVWASLTGAAQTPSKDITGSFKRLRVRGAAALSGARKACEPGWVATADPAANIRESR